MWLGRKYTWIFNSVHSACGLKMQNLVSWKLPKNVRFPYFREEGGGQERYKNFLIFYFLIRGRREGVQVNKDNFFIYALFWKGNEWGLRQLWLAGKETCFFLTQTICSLPKTKIINILFPKRAVVCNVVNITWVKKLT